MQIDERLRVCVASHVETWLLGGDHAAVAAVVPDYEHALNKGSLLSPPLGTAIPALARLAASRGSSTILGELRTAGGEAWARAHNDHNTLALLNEHPVSFRTELPPAYAPAAATSAAGGAAASGAETSRTAQAGSASAAARNFVKKGGGSYSACALI